MEKNIFKCKYCEYSSDIKGNFIRHLIIKHTDKINISNDSKTNTVVSKLQCSMCGKTLSSKNSLAKHTPICKGVSNPLECHLCHKVFSHRNSKNFHIKTCKENQSKNETSIEYIKMNNIDTEYIYLLKEREFIKTGENIYKIGRTKQNNLNRIQNYPNGTILLYQRKCINSTILEKKIIANLKIKFKNRLDIGYEYFEGDENAMQDIINDIIKQENTNMGKNEVEVYEEISEIELGYDKRVRCSKCGKFLSSNSYLKKHIINCVGKINILDCPICNKTFANRFSKSVHIKKCKLVDHNAELSSTKEEDVNKEINDFDLIMFNNVNETIEFDISHLKIDDLLPNIINKNPNSSLIYFYDNLFNNKKNHFIIKESKRYTYSNVHIGMKIWKNFTDKYIYPIIFKHIIDIIIDFFKPNIEELKSLYEYLNNITTPEYKNKYKDNIEQLKLLFNTFK